MVLFPCQYGDASYTTYVDTTYCFTFVAEGNHKLIESTCCKAFHDVPEDWSPSDQHHWLRLDFSFFRQARSLAAGENHNLHVQHPLPTCPTIEVLAPTAPGP